MFLEFFTGLLHAARFLGFIGIAIVIAILLVLRVNKGGQLGILLKGIFANLLPASRNQVTKHKIEGKVCLITGASSGLGLSTAKKLAAKNVGKLVLACLPSTITPQLKSEVEAARKTGGTTEVTLIGLDLANFDSIENCVNELDDTMNQPIDILILNAGLAPARTIVTKQGFESAFGINYVGHFLFTMLLLQKGLILNKSFCQVDCTPEEEEERKENVKTNNREEKEEEENKQETKENTKRNKEEEKPRIIMIASEAHRGAQPLHKQKLGTIPQTNLLNALSLYSHSKLCVTTWSLELARRLKGEVKVLALCPGPMNTRIGSGAPFWAKPLVWLLLNLFFPSPDIAVRYVLNLARKATFSKDTGIYCFKMDEVAPSADAQDPQAAKLLWHETLELIHQHGGPQLKC